MPKSFQTKRKAKAPSTDVLLSDHTPESGPQPRLDQHDYTYSALPSANHFRLLRLAVKGDPSGGFTCSLHAFELSSCPQFEAVSYTWDRFSELTFGSIRVVDSLLEQSRNNVVGEFRIRANLYRFLKVLRNTSVEDVWLWIDAICINQASPEERSLQVRLMGQIYSQAYAVIAWLDSCLNPPNSSGVFQSALDMGDYDTHVSEQISTDRCDDSKLFHLWVVGQLPYWRRKWIVQELILARTVILMYGYCSYPITTLEAVALWVTEDPTAVNRTGVPLLAEPMMQLALHRAQSDYDPQAWTSLHALLRRYRWQQCSDASDHVYALFNLVGRHREHLRVDYGLSPGQRLKATLEFLKTYDRMPPAKTLSVTYLLCRWFRLWPDQPFKHCLSPNPPLDIGSMLTIASDRGEPEVLKETSLSIWARESTRTLYDIPSWTLQCSSASKGLAAAGTAPTDATNYWRLLPMTLAPVPTAPNFSQRTMTFFRVTEPVERFGFASAWFQRGDRIWQFEDTKLAFVVRATAHDHDRVRIVGRAHIFSPIDDEIMGDYLPHADSEKYPSHHILLDCHDLQNLAVWAMVESDLDVDAWHEHEWYDPC